MKKDSGTRIKRGTKNVFADLGFPDAETHLLKAELVTRIQGVVTVQGLTQVAAAKRMGLSQPDVSRLLNGQFRDVSVERLMRLLTRLGCDVDITIRNHGKCQRKWLEIPLMRTLPSLQRAPIACSAFAQPWVEGIAVRNDILVWPGPNGSRVFYRCLRHIDLKFSSQARFSRSENFR